VKSRQVGWLTSFMERGGMASCRASRSCRYSTGTIDMVEASCPAFTYIPPLACKGSQSPGAQETVDNQATGCVEVLRASGRWKTGWGQWLV